MQSRAMMAEGKFRRGRRAEDGDNDRQGQRSDGDY